MTENAATTAPLGKILTADEEPVGGCRLVHSGHAVSSW